MTWTYSLEIIRPNKTTGGVSAGRESLEDTLAELRKDVAYYVALGYAVNVEFVREHCPDCKGAGGRQHKTNRFKRVQCKQCKGAGTIQQLSAETVRQELTKQEQAS